jgi:hypothetical protein
MQSELIKYYRINGAINDLKNKTQNCARERQELFFQTNQKYGRKKTLCFKTKCSEKYLRPKNQVRNLGYCIMRGL